MHSSRPTGTRTRAAPAEVVPLKNRLPNQPCRGCSSKKQTAKPTMPSLPCQQAKHHPYECQPAREGANANSTARDTCAPPRMHATATTPLCMHTPSLPRRPHAQKRIPPPFWIDHEMPCQAHAPATPGPTSDEPPRSPLLPTNTRAPIDRSRPYQRRCRPRRSHAQNRIPPPFF